MTIRRREFLALAAAGVAFPRVVLAQQQRTGPGGKPWLVAFLTTETKEQSAVSSLGPLQEGLKDVGYVEGRDYKVEARYASGGVTQLPGLAMELVRLRPDVIVGAGTVVPALQPLTTTIPIIASPLSPTNVDQFVGTMSRPTGNVTGLLTDQASLTGKHCDLALELVPQAKRIGAVADASSASQAAGTQDALAAAAAARMFTPIVAEVKVVGDLGPAFRFLADQHVDVAIMGSSNIGAGNRAAVTVAAAAAHVPTIYNEHGYVQAGGLISYGFDRAASYRRVATFVQRIFAGAKPAELPVEETSTYTMAININTAKALGLTIPTSVLFRADEVIQ